MRVRRSLFTLTLASAMLVGTFVAGGPNSLAAGQASFTSVRADRAVFPGLMECDGAGEDDGDDRDDDLCVAFTEEGTGNSTGAAIEVSASRTVTATCLSSSGESSVTKTEQLTQDSETKSFTNDQKAGRWIKEGKVMFQTKFTDFAAAANALCSRLALDTVVVKDYSVKYSDITVRDTENGVVEPVPAPEEPYSEILHFTFDPEAQGLSCTVEGIGEGHCWTP